jgi:iron complex transport system substrate-binding protein
VLALTAGTLAGIWDGMRAVARALGREAAGEALVAQERERLDAVSRRVAGLRRPSVVLLEWMDPIFAMGNWGPELVEIANAELLIGSKGEHSAAIEWKQVLDADPEYLIVAPCGFDLARTLGERHVLEALPGWSGLRAVREGKLAYADGNLLFNRSGMTVSRTAEVIAEILHGAVLTRSGEGSEWTWAKDIPEKDAR